MNDAETKEPTNDGSLPPPKQLLLPSFAEIVLIVIDAAPGVTAFQISAYLELMTGCVINPKLVRSALHDLHANMLVRSNQDKTSNRRYQIQEEGLQALTYSRQLRARLKRSILRLPPPITGDRDVAGKSTRLSGGDPWIPRFRPGGGALTGNPDRPSEQSPLQSGVSPSSSNREPTGHQNPLLVLPASHSLLNPGICPRLLARQQTGKRYCGLLSLEYDSA